MNRAPPDPIDCNPEQLVSLYARVTVYTVSAFLNLTYVYLIARIGLKAVSTLLLSLLFLLFATNIGASLVIYYWHSYQSLKCGSQDPKLLREAIIGNAITSGATLICYMTSQQIFAYKYWTLSYRIESIFLNEASPDLKCQRRVNYCFIFNIFFWQVVSAVSFIIIKLVTSPFWINFALFFGYWTFLVISFGSLYILWNAFKRITAFSTSQNLHVNTNMIRLHLVAYVVLIFSFLLFLIGFIANNQLVLSLFTVIVGVANLLSELILVFIFNAILNGEVIRTKSVKHASLS